jgi:hypothetical protein
MFTRHFCALDLEVCRAQVHALHVRTSNKKIFILHLTNHLFHIVCHKREEIRFLSLCF